MDKRAIILARRYARAYLAVYAQDLSPENYGGCYKLAAHFTDKPELGFLLDVSLIKRDIKIKELEQMVAACGLPLSCNKLAVLLVDHKRAFLLGEAARQIAQLYKRQAGIDTCYVSSSMVVSAQEKTTVERALQEQTGLTLTFEYGIDPALIAGIRCQATDFLWEHSVDQIIRRLENSLKH